MTERYLGSIISPSPVEPSSNLSNATASGVWHLHDPLTFGQAGDWPDAANVPSVGIATRGQVNPLVTDIDKFVPESAGNATDFGDLTVARHASSSMGNDTRGIFAGGWDNYGGSSRSNVIDYITYATTGNATDFGDVAATTSDANCSASNNVRGITFGGRLYSNGNLSNSIEYLTIASTGNATDFGDLSVGGSNTQRHRQGNGMSGSTTRGLASGGYTPAALSNVIQYVTIASAGNSTDFGDMSSSTDELAHMSSNTRAVITGGSGGGSTIINTIEYVTIASTGNVTDFGDMTVAKAYLMGASSSTKGFILGGYTGSANVNTIETITFSTTGDGTDFGDLSAVSRSGSANASSHASVQAPEVGTAIGLFTAGYNADRSLIIKTIYKIIIETTGNATAFGYLTLARYDLGSVGSSTRLVSGGGNVDYSNPSNVMDYVTFASTGNATDFGDRTVSQFSVTGLSSSTRGLFAGGNYSSLDDTIDYITIASTGNATDFGNMTVAKFGVAGAGSTTRGILYGGSPTNATTYTNVIEYITYTSTGNGTDFGDATVARRDSGAVSSSTRLCALGGYTGSVSNVIDYITIASTGDATDFGDLSAARYVANSNASSKVRGVVAGGVESGRVNTIEYITIASTGNATDFGDCSGAISQQGGASNSHGGL